MDAGELARRWHTVPRVTASPLATLQSPCTQPAPRWTMSAGRGGDLAVCLHPPRPWRHPALRSDRGTGDARTGQPTVGDEWFEDPTRLLRAELLVAPEQALDRFVTRVEQIGMDETAQWRTSYTRTGAEAGHEGES